VTTHDVREPAQEVMIKAYHFLRRDMTTTFGHEPPWKIGETRTIEGGCALCHRGYHSSPTWYDALTNATGPIACKVEVSKPIEKVSDKQVSCTRKLLECRDATLSLYRFAYECTEKFLMEERITNFTLWKGAAALQSWLEGKTDDKIRIEKGKEAYRMFLKSSDARDRSAAYVVTTALGFGAVNFGEPVAIASVTSDQLIGRAASFGEGARTKAWIKRRFGTLMTELFRQRKSGALTRRHPKAEIYVHRGLLENCTKLGYFACVDFFEKVYGSEASSPYIRMEAFPGYRMLSGLNALPETPKFKPISDGAIVKLPVVRLGEEFVMDVENPYNT